MSTAIGCKINVPSLVGKYKWQIALLGLLTSLYYLILPIPSPAVRHLQAVQLMSADQLKEIGSLILCYQKAHGAQRPLSLSQLLPKIQVRDLERLHSLIHQKKIPGLTTPAGLDVLGEDADYIVISSGDSKVLICEKPGLWSDGSLAVCYDDLTVVRLKSK